MTKADSESEIHNNNLDCNTKEEIIQQCKDRFLFTTLSSHTWHEVIYDFIDNINLEYTISLDKNQDGISKIKIENNTGHISLTEEHLFEEGKRVYMGESINSRLMYDFNKNASDTIFSSLWPTQLVVKEEGQFILENGEARKSMTLYCANDKDGSKYGYRHWVEGVGDLKGLYSIVHACTNDTSSKLICFYKDDERLYLTPEMFSCSLTSTNNELHKRYFIYPNPTSGFITTGPEFPLHYIEVYGMDGKLEYTSKGKQDQSSQDISALNNGVKVVKIYNKDNSIQFIKLLKIQ